MFVTEEKFYFCDCLINMAIAVNLQLRRSTRMRKRCFYSEYVMPNMHKKVCYKNCLLLKYAMII